MRDHALPWTAAEVLAYRDFPRLTLHVPVRPAPWHTKDTKGVWTWTPHGQIPFAEMVWHGVNHAIWPDTIQRPRVMNQHCPYHGVDRVLWVQEPIYYVGRSVADLNRRYLLLRDSKASLDVIRYALGVQYMADCPNPPAEARTTRRMPKWAARLFYRINDLWTEQQGQEWVWTISLQRVPSAGKEWEEEIVP